MYYSNIRDSRHSWQKQNLVTIKGRRGHYDLVVCANCKMKGRRYGFETVEVAETYKVDNVYLCPKAPTEQKAKQVRVLYCMAQGRQFANLTPGSIHEVVTAPEPYKDDHKGLWVMGIGEPVKLLNGEFDIIN